MRILLLLLILLVMVSPAYAYTVSYYANVSKDSQTTTESSGHGSDTGTYTKVNADGRYFRPYVQYDLGSLSAYINSSDILEAKMCVHYWRVESSFTDYLYHVYDTSWSEADISHANQPCGVGDPGTGYCNGTYSDSKSIGSANEWICWNVLPGVKTAISNSSGAVSFMMWTNSEGSGTGWDHDFRTKEYNSSSHKSYINITFNTTAPPPVYVEITYYNLTSGGGCTSWNTNKETACSITDTTPTISINTTIGATCAIGISNQNYSNLGQSRACSGINTTSHTCTLTAQDELAEGTNYLYIGCKSLFNIENLTSTSSGLKAHISSSDYETLGRDAIESAVLHTLGRDYLVYTDQKIYARNSANQQAVGTFDKVVKWLNKIWAFNVLSGNQTNQSFFNVSPVLYVLEFRNATPSSINQTIQQLINATK